MIKSEKRKDFIMLNFALAWPEEVYEYYSHGHCMQLAAALNRKLGWEIQLTMQPAEGPHSTYVEHAWVTDPSGRYCLDSDGIYSMEKNGFIGAWSPIHTSLSESELKDFTLLGSRPFTDAEWDESVQKAIAIVEKYYPLKKLAELLSTMDVSPSPEGIASEITPSDLPLLYHGTTRRQWREKHENPSYLNLTCSLSDAQQYADEWVESETDDYGDCHPIVVRISPTALIKLLKKPGVTLEPDWGWVEGQEHDAKKNGGAFTDADATWKNSLAKCNGLGIQGFQDKFKMAFWNVSETTLELG